MGDDACCPSLDGVWMECCDRLPVPEHGLTTISLKAWHGGYVAAERWGAVRVRPQELTETRFFVVPHADGAAEELSEKP